MMAGRDYGVVMAGRAGRPCDACGKEKARWYCAADEAYLCDCCDVSVHAANALARRHARVPLAPNGAPVKLHRRPRTRPRNSRHPPLPPSSPISPSSVLVPSSAKTTLGKAEDGTKVKKELIAEEECLADGDIDGWCVVPANIDNINSRGSLASPDMKTEEMSDPDFDLDLDLSHEVPLIYEPLLQELMLMTPDGEDNIMEEILPSNCTPPPYLTPLYLATSHRASLEEEHRHGCHHHQEDKQEDIPDDYATEIEDGTISIDNLSSGVGDEFDMLELCEGASSEGLDLHHPGIASWGNNNHEYGTNIVSSSSSCNPFKGEWDHHDHGSLQVDPSCHVKLEQDAMLPLGLPTPGMRNWFCTTEKKEEEEEGAVGRTISLKLDYEEVLSAWSDRGSLWMDGQRPQIVPDLDMASLEARIMAESIRGGCFDHLNQVPVIERVIGEAREARVLRYREKRRSRHFSKKIRYEVRKLNAEKRPRLKGRFVRRSDPEEASETT